MEKSWAKLGASSIHDQIINNNLGLLTLIILAYPILFLLFTNNIKGAKVPKTLILTPN